MAASDRQNAPTGWRARPDRPLLPAIVLSPYIRGCDGPRPPAGLRPRPAAPAARACGARLGAPGFPQARDRRPPGRAPGRRAPDFPLALDLGSHGDEIAAALGERKTVGCLVRADLGEGFARRARGPAVVADEEFLPFAAAQLRPGAERDGPALGQRPARHADPDRPHPEARRAVAGRHAGRRPPCGSCARRWPRRKARSRAASARASRRSPICATPRACCSARALPCRWPTARRSRSNTRARSP